jgi:hypothetical protein
LSKAVIAMQTKIRQYLAVKSYHHKKEVERQRKGRIEIPLKILNFLQPRKKEKERKKKKRRKKRKKERRKKKERKKNRKLKKVTENSMKILKRNRAEEKFSCADQR